MKRQMLIALILMITLPLSACKGVSSDHVGPIISDITISNKVVVISDCLNTSVAITAKVMDESKITSVLLWYRVGSDGPFASVSMDAQGGLYTASVKGVDLQANNYGAIEFYITAADGNNNTTESLHNNSIQFLPCVNN